MIHPSGGTRDTLLAPCKVNLTLDVFAPRSDGFHDLDSVVMKFLPADELNMDWRHRPGEEGVMLTCDDPNLPTNEKNLAYRAATDFMSAFGIQGKVQIALRKRLPYQAGLGSASSDAAVVLNWLSAHLSNNSKKLLQVAAGIGSDVPLFLGGRLVRMQGRGEQVGSLHLPLPIYHGVIVKPHVGVSTPMAYKLLDAIADRQPGNATQNFLSVLQSSPNDLNAIASALGNDFEAAVLPAFAEVADAHRAVRDAGALRALLCGSGSAVFGLAQDAGQAETMARKLRETNRFAWVEVAESLP